MLKFTVSQDVVLLQDHIIIIFEYKLSFLILFSVFHGQVAQNLRAHFRNKIF